MPSRAMLMTGRGMFEIQSDGLTIPSSHTTLPQHSERKYSKNECIVFFHFNNKSRNDKKWNSLIL